MDMAATIIVSMLGIYAACGLVVALAFVSLGVMQVQPQSMSCGARILILPGAALLWPYVLMRWRHAKGAR